MGDPELAVADIHSMSHLITQATAGRKFQTAVLTVFAATTMLLAFVGIYRLLAYSLRQHTGEIGIRMALGSSRAGVVRLVAAEGLRLLLAGLVLGLIAAIGCTRLLNSFL
jgi:ABC-type antimicrobial peptide transport system permease subunit